MSQVFSHSTTRESKSVSKGRRTQNLLQKHAIFSSHKLSLYTHLQGLTWQECQAKEEAPHLGASLSTSKIHSSKSNWMKPHKQGAANDIAYRDKCHVNKDRVSLQLEYQLPLTNHTKM